MISEWKRCLKMIKYGYNVKSSAVVAVIFFVVGILFCIVDPHMSTMGGLYVVMGPMMLVQVSYTSLMAGLSLSSPRRRFMEIQLQDGLQLLVGILGYLLVVLIAVIVNGLAPEQSTNYTMSILCTGMITGILIAYLGVVYKYFVLSLILFIGGFMFVYIGLWDTMVEEMPSINLAGAVFFGLLFILLGEVLGGIFRRVFYRKPLSKYSLGAALRKQM